MSIQYILLDPSTMAAPLPWSAAKQPSSEYEAVSSPFSGDNGLLDDICRITEPYSTLFAELADFEPATLPQTAAASDKHTCPPFLTPPASPPTGLQSNDELLAIANELLDLRQSPIEFDSLFKSVEEEVKNWEFDVFSPGASSPDSSVATDYDVMSPEDVYGSVLSDDSGAYLTLDASILSESTEVNFDEHSYSRPSREKRETSRKDSRRAKAEIKKTRSRYSVEDRKQRKKEQNKQAAIRYRQKKKEELMRFATYEKELVQTHRSLCREANKVRAEIRIVKNIMREHFTAKGLL